MSRVARVGIAGALAVLAVFAVLPGAGADDAEEVLTRARNATVREEFTGLVQIEWRSEGKWRTARVRVQGTAGTVQVGEGARKAEGRGDDRWIAGVSGWQAGWSEPVRGEVPSPSDHWDLRLTRGAEVADRPTLVVTAADPDTGRDRLRVYCDRDTGVMLRREVLDRRGRVARAVGFVEVNKLDGPRARTAGEPAPTTKGGDRSPVEVRTLPSGFQAPERVDGGYVLAGRYLRDDGVVQLYYSDGLFGISVFQQRGDLNWNGLPRGGDGVEVEGVTGRGYEVAGGTVLVWARDDVTRTIVSDATVADLRAFAADFDASTSDAPGLVERVTDFVLGPFGWR